MVIEKVIGDRAALAVIKFVRGHSRKT